MTLAVETIKFDSDTAERKKLFTAASFSHPAKMHLSLQVYLVERYTKVGDTILDPMGGSGTLLAACALGRNVILVELESKFCDMMAGFQCDGKTKGYKDVWIEPIEAGWLVYSGIESVEHLFETQKEAEDFYKTWEWKGAPRDKGVRWQEGKEGYWTKKIIPAKCGKAKNHKPHFVKGNWQKIKSLGPMLGYTMGQAVILCGDARNLDGLLADNILFSPPYAETLQKGKSLKERTDGMAEMLRKERPYTYDKTGADSANKGCGDNQNNISYLPYGQIDTVISSPPYEKTITQGGNTGAHKAKYGYQGENIGYGKADAVITSPPYEGSLEAGSRHTKGGIPERDKRLGQSGTYEDLDESVERLRNHGRTAPKAGGAYGRSLAHPYSGAAENIGNLKSENYLQAMLLVYRQCHKVLKEKGLMILVVKNFIRDKKVIRLDLDTIKICEKAGFKLIERLKRKLTQQSFWRIIYHNKFPDVEKIEYEDILVFQRAKARPEGE